MTSKAELMALILAALMQNPDMRVWVSAQDSNPSSGGAMRAWVQLARDYADEIELAAV